MTFNDRNHGLFFLVFTIMNMYSKDTNQDNKMYTCTYTYKQYQMHG